MNPTDTSERGLEILICRALTGSDCTPRPAGTPPVVAEMPVAYGGVGWFPGDPADYDREYCVDIVQLAAFLHATQPEVAEAVGINHDLPLQDNDSPTRRKFLARLQSEVSKRGVVDVLRGGIQHGPHRIELFYGTPSPGNERAQALYEQNRFTVTRQLRYSRDETQRALDLALFINGLPVFTFELKNRLTKQTVHDAIEQYRRDRNPREKLFELGRCVAHFAVDDSEVWFCTHLQGKASWFLPFNKGYNDGAGNPPNPQGLKTDYLWREVLTRDSLTNIIENFAQLTEEKDLKTGKKKRRQIFPRYHQLDVVRKLLAGAAAHGGGAALFDPTFRRQRQVQLHRLAGPPAYRSRQRRQAGVRFGYRSYRPAHPGPADPRHGQAVCPGERHSRARRTFRRSAPIHREWQKDHHHHAAEVPVHPRRNREQPSRAPFCDPH